MRTEFESAYAVWWSRVKYSLGGYATGGGASRVAQLAKPDNRIYLGCAAVSSDPAWMEGAVEAAWHAVKSLHERAMRS
jgi:monoamine oxidase